MRRLVTAAALMLGVAALSGCETMSEGQCLAGDWTGQGYRDGQGGQLSSRLDSHAQACARHGVTPDAGAYVAGWRQGVIQFCRPENGFEVGRRGTAYNGVCSGLHEERRFLAAYEDGRVVHEAEAAVSSARSSVDTEASRLAELDDKIAYFEREARDMRKTEQERTRARDRAVELRRERRDTERDWRRAQDALDDAERRARDVQRRYGL